MMALQFQEESTWVKIESSALPQSVSDRVLHVQDKDVANLHYEPVDRRSTSTAVYLDDRLG